MQVYSACVSKYYTGCFLTVRVFSCPSRYIPTFRTEGRVLYFFEKSFFFSVYVVFIAKSEFFSKKPSFVSNKFIFREILHFNYLKRAFPAFCKFFGPIGGQKLGNARNSKSAKSGVSQIHLRQLFHFINVRCNYCLQLSLS